MHKFDNEIFETMRPQFPKYCYWDGLFSDEQLDNIIEYCETQPKDKAMILGKGLDESYRKTNVSWIQPNKETNWFIQPYHDKVRKLNHEFYKFDLTHYENIQYTCYDQPKSKYDFHMDSGFDVSINVIRKLSCVLLLDDPNKFEGGDFEIKYSGKGQKEKIEFVRGRLIIFPSFILHRVTPVTKGIRRTLVNWILGPTWK